MAITVGDAEGITRSLPRPRYLCLLRRNRHPRVACRAWKAHARRWGPRSRVLPVPRRARPATRARCSRIRASSRTRRSPSGPGRRPFA